MYCTNCGRKLPEDGSPCICGTQNGNFNTQPPVRPVTPVHGMLVILSEDGAVVMNDCYNGFDEEARRNIQNFMQQQAEKEQEQQRQQQVQSQMQPNQIQQSPEHRE